MVRLSAFLVNREAVVTAGIKCKDCGYLGQRVRDTRQVVDADAHFRSTGDCLTNSIVSSDKLCDTHPVCFAKHRNFYKDVRAEPQALKAAIDVVLDCPHFQPWQPGVSPQALAEMIYQEKLLAEQRAWQAEQARLADTRHQDNLRELAKATAWNWRGVLLAAGIGAVATLLAGLIGALATLAVLLSRPFSL